MILFSIFFTERFRVVRTKICIILLCFVCFVERKRPYIHVNYYIFGVIYIHGWYLSFL